MHTLNSFADLAEAVEEFIANSTYLTATVGGRDAYGDAVITVAARVGRVFGRLYLTGTTVSAQDELTGEWKLTENLDEALDHVGVRAQA